ncbi:X-Pro dipeptidyl-peptidase [Aliifodinibius salipaludis]|uniref:X-Pro dipeptidyl-peptidase n=1 Tax=Fodinibius salipaludis TaxID=2032627 RepID=A0A2A2G6P7_9BACT|nr:CocE/NonD family hydrolase [Aliifodinibius salipaludis]PAU92810.1 X-Pro dipeptidyl-peptidase [Aliifodinibius salipaludis]
MLASKRIFILLGVVLLTLYLTVPSFAQENNFSSKDYEKSQFDIEMRDGIKLHAVVYAPKDTTQDYPILMKRTPYSCRPYEEGKVPERIMHNPHLQKEGFIFVCQDVRGRWMSEGDYTTMTPNREDPDKIDESSDTYDTVEWLINNIPNNNGKVGQWGISYPGFYTTAGLPDAHPAMAASSPQAPISDFFFDDFHHHGAYLMSYWYVTPLFGIQHEGPTDTAWYNFTDTGTQDGYYFYESITPLSKADKYYSEENFFWQELKTHPNYDEFWQSRNILPHLKDIDHPVMTVGGWFDAEDLYGPLNTYRSIEEKNPDTENTIVMGPWSHGQWASGNSHQSVGEIYFGEGISAFYQKEIEYPFFMKHLKGTDTKELPEAYMFDTGKKSWSTFDHWPPKRVQQESWYIHSDGDLNSKKPNNTNQKYTEYKSDIDNPVPYKEESELVFIPQDYMTDDQRFASRRPDVVTFETEVLEEDVTLAGDILADLFVSTSGTASDWVVKLVDVYPPSIEENEHTPKNVEFDNYHQMVRSEVMRGRFRDSYENPEPFKPNKVTNIELPLQDVYHTFKKGHKIQIQIQSTWFPLVDLNPQKYVPNIFEADENDFQDAIQRIYHSSKYPTSIDVKVLEKN